MLVLPVFAAAILLTLALYAQLIRGQVLTMARAKGKKGPPVKEPGRKPAPKKAAKRR
jgi:hypothetical protein